MPLVFGGAPVINTLLSMYTTKAWKQGIHPLFFVGLALVIIGAASVLTFAPKPGAAAHGDQTAKAVVPVESADQ
jgi:hypothetical protein